MRRAVGAALALLALSACYAPGERPYRPPHLTRTEAVADGRTFYLRDCAWCHGNDGAGTERGPDLLTGTNGPAMNHFVISSGRMPLEHEGQRVERRAAVYDPGEIEAIVEFMRSFDAPGPELPEPDPNADLQAGLALYQENCAACHSTTGVGGALTAGERETVYEEGPSLVAPGLLDSSPTEIAAAVRVGPGTMPVFSEETLDDEELSEVTRYVVYLQNPSDRGGAPIGRVGPVAEGAIGWVVGLGVLLVFIRWAGTKRGEL